MFVVIIISLMLNFFIHGGVWPMELNLESKWRRGYRNVNKAGDIVQYLVKNYSFVGRSACDPDKPPVSTDFGRLPTIIIYSIVEAKEQDKILGIIKQYMQLNNIKSVTVKFYESENWIVKKDPSGNDSGMRGPEKLINEITLKN